MTKNYRLKIFLNRLSQNLTNILIHFFSKGTTAKNAYSRIRRGTQISYPFLAYIYKKTRPPAHHPTFRLQLLKTVMSSLQKKIGGYHIDIDCDENNSLVQAISQGQTPIILAPHLRITTILGYYLEQQKMPLAVLANSDPNKEFLNFGMQQPLSFIKADLSCLFRIRDCLNTKIPVLVMPDFERGQCKNKLNKFISPSIFLFANKFHLPVIFMWIDLDQQGSIKLKFSKPVHTDAIALMHEFVDFIEQRIPWRVVCQDPKF